MSGIQSTPVNPITPEEVVQQLRALRQQIPEFVLLPQADAAILARAGSVDPRFVQTTINAVGASEPLRNVIGSSAEELRQETELAAR